MLYDVVTKDATKLFFEGVPADKDPFLLQSPWSITIKAEFGNHGSVYSEYATLTISTPCISTTIEQPDPAIADMLYEVG